MTLLEATGGVKVEIADETAWVWELDGDFDTVHLHDAGSPRALVWTDITTLCRSVDIQRGRNSALASFGVGKCDLEFIDNAGDLVDTNIVTGKCVRVTALNSSAVEQPLFAGYIDHRGGGISWQYDGFQTLVRFRCYDLIGLVGDAVYDTVTEERAGLLAEEIVQGWWPGGGDAPMAVDRGRALIELDATLTPNDCAAAEQGGFWCAADGEIRFDARFAGFDTARQATSQATFTDDGGSDVGYSPVITYETTERFGAWNVNDYTAASTTAEADWWPSASLSTPALNDPDGLDTKHLAEWMLFQYETENVYPTGVSLVPGDDDRLDHVVERDLRDRVTIEHDPLGAESQRVHECWIESIQHRITPSSWSSTFGVSTVDRFDWATPEDWMIVGTTLDRSKVGTGKVAP